MTATDPQSIAEATRLRMFAGDAAASLLGMQVTAIGPGTATVTMPVRADLLNGFGICHGGLIATLADTAFAYACNSFGELAVASGFDVELLAPGRNGDVLTAHAMLQSQAVRNGVYDVDVRNQHGERIALFRGRSQRVARKAADPRA
jgi:acyl-CoA thioesterase